MVIPGVTIHNYNVSGFRGVAWHFEYEGRYYIASANDTLDHGPETMIFSADARGRVTDWTDLYVYDDINCEVAIFGFTTNID